MLVLDLLPLARYIPALSPAASGIRLFSCSWVIGMAIPAASVTRIGLRPQTDRVRVVIADDTSLGCELLKRVLGLHPRIKVVATVLSEKELPVKVSQTAAEVLLISPDLCEGKLSGLRAVSELHASQPTLPIVVICDHASGDLVLSSFRAGARGFLCRSESIEMLCKCIQVVRSGQIWANNSQLEVLLGALVQMPPVRVVNANGFSLLAERERQVATLVGEGLINREIAGRLGISEHTVSNHLFRIYNKLGISNRVELVLYIMRQREQSRPAS